MNTLAPSFLIGSSSFLQVTRTCMKAWVSSNRPYQESELFEMCMISIFILVSFEKK